MEIVKLPVGVVFPICSVSTDKVPVTGLGVNVAVAPAGRPEATVKVIEPVKLVLATVMVAVPDEPGTRARLAGEALRVNDPEPPEDTVNPRVVECVRGFPVPLLDVPVTVMVFEPVFAVAEAVRVRVEVADVVVAETTRVVVDH